MQPKQIAQAAREAGEDKKAEEPLILDIAKLTSIANYFVIMHGNSDRQIRAIADHIVDSLEKKKVRCLHVEGMDSGNWVLLDYGSVIVHIFYRETREFYGIERLWGEAPLVS